MKIEGKVHFASEPSIIIEKLDCIQTLRLCRRPSLALAV